MADDIEMVSADSHFLEPPTIWRDWLPKRFHELAPSLVSDGHGGHAWRYGSTLEAEAIGLTALPGLAEEDLRPRGVTYAQARRGTYDGGDRILDQNEDGVAAEVIFPTSRTLAHFLNHPDREFQLAGVEAYNRFSLEEFCARAPERLFPVAQLPSTGLEDSIKTLQWAADRGYRAAVLPCWPSGADDLGTGDAAFWAAAEEMEMPVCIHASLRSREERLLIRELIEHGAVPAEFEDRGLQREPIVAVPLRLEYHSQLGNPGYGMGRAASVLATLLTSGLFDAHPGISVALIETWVGWIPHLLDAVDDLWVRNRRRFNIPLQRRPSEYWYTNMAAAFIDDRAGVALREFVGVKNMMWSSDYPHFCTKWPRSRTTASESLRGVPRSEVKQIVGGNCRSFFGLPAPSAPRIEALGPVNYPQVGSSNDASS